MTVAAVARCLDVLECLASTFRTDARPDAPVAGTLSVAGPISRITPERYAQIHAALAADVAALEAA